MAEKIIVLGVHVRHIGFSSYLYYIDLTTQGLEATLGKKDIHPCLCKCMDSQQGKQVDAAPIPVRHQSFRPQMT
jgi:hypothetical protein